MMDIYDKIKIADAVNVQAITLDDGPRGYVNFDKGAAQKYVIDRHGMVPAYRIFFDNACLLKRNNLLLVSILLCNMLVAPQVELAYSF